MSLRILVVAGLLNGTTFFTSPDDRDGTGSTGTAATSGTSTATATDATRDTRSSRCREQEPAGSDITLVTDDEPGDRLVVDGRVLGRDRVTPVRNAKVYVFHTDAAGYYSEHRSMDNTNPRLCGILRTDEQGRYRFTTVRPGRYATGGPAPHVHYEVTPAGASKTRSFTLTFEAVKSGGAIASEPWATTRPVVRDKGAWHCTRDLWLQ